MLVLSRQRDETIMIGDDIEVTVVDIRGDKVRLGINAPKEISVHRKEVYDAIKRENKAAAQVKPEDLSGLGGKIGGQGNGGVAGNGSSGANGGAAHQGPSKQGPPKDEKKSAAKEPKIKVRSIAGLIGSAIRSIHEETSVSNLFA